VGKAARQARRIIQQPLWSVSALTVMAKIDTGTALAEGFFWMGEKWRYGYEGVEENPTEALKLYNHAADLGFPRAYLRIGEMLERGIGVEANLSKAFAFYDKAAAAGEITAFAAMARLVSRTKQAPKAEILWKKYFAELARAGDVDLGPDEPASSIHSYLFSKLAAFEMPRVYAPMKHHREELIAFMQEYLEVASDPEQLDVMDAMMEWVKEKLSEE
jgi:TPR repeat protein